MGWLALCGVLWLSAGAWWATSDMGGRWARKVAAGRRARLAGPALLLLSLCVAVASLLLLLSPSLSSSGSLTTAGWAVAAATGTVFVTLQALGARVVVEVLRRSRAPETTRRPPASKPEDHETP